MGAPLFNTVQLTLRPTVAVSLTLTKRSISSYTYCVNKSLSHCWNSTQSNFQKTKVCQPCATVSLTTRKMSNMQELCGVHRDFIFRQLLDYKSFTYTYLLADPDSKEAVIIDPVIDLVERDCKIVKDLDLNLKYAVNTHVHADHITGTGEIKKRIPSCQSIISEVSSAKADVKTKDRSQIKFGKFILEVRSTPGHTNGCCTYVWHEKNMAFTGDAILIRGCGRTDFQEGSPATLYDSVHKQILSLPDSFALYPAHDYTGQTSTTVGEEKRLNPRLSKPKPEFIEIMKKLNLPYPKQIDKALPANMVCGVFETQEQQNKKL